MKRLPTLAVLSLLLGAVARGDTQGQGQLGFQGYYLGGDSRRIADISGVVFQFKHFIPRVGLLSGSLESYGREGRLQFGDNYLQLRGLSWAGWRWTFTGGDFRTSPNQVEFPFYNLFYPEIAARGFQLEASRENRRYSVYWGNETLLEGPRIPFRVRAPQRVLGASMQQRIGSRLQVGARFLRLSSSERSVEENSFFFPPGRDFRTVDTLAVQSVFTPASRLRLYSEASVSAGERLGESEPRGRPAGSSLVGAVWESSRLTARTNYAYQAASYLPVIGYFAGDRRGPFAEMRLRPVRRLELFGSASRYSNNLRSDPELPTYRSTGTSAGASATLPWRFTATTQLSTIRFSSRQPESPQPRTSDNRQLATNLVRPIRRHSLRLAVRELKLMANQRLERHRTAEVEDVFQLKRFVFGGAARTQRLVSDQRRNSMFYRGLAQARLGRLTAHADFEIGRDLVNRTVFATNAVSTTAVGMTARLSQTWHLQADVFRNRLTAELNPESIFVLENRGLVTPLVLSGFNQWSLYFRLSRQLHWGGAIPASDLDQYAARQMPLVGTVEGFVRLQAMVGAEPATGVPVSLDGMQTVHTDTNGRFRFVEVPEGPHHVALAMRQLPAEYEAGSLRPVPVVVQPRRISRADLEVIRLMTLSGSVSAPPEVSRENIVVRLRPTPRYTTTDAEGNFAFYNLREGDYDVALDERTLPEHSVVAGAAGTAVAARLGAELLPVRFELQVRRPEKPVRHITLP